MDDNDAGFRLQFAYASQLAGPGDFAESILKF